MLLFREGKISAYLVDQSQKPMQTEALIEGSDSGGSGQTEKLQKNYKPMK